jgi:UDP-N-acetylglucosamine 2-epimerase (non-hydrolysing)
MMEAAEEPAGLPAGAMARPIYVVIGTRAQLIKMAPVMLALRDAGLAYRFVFTAQHAETIERLRDEFGLPPPAQTLHLGLEASTPRRFLRWSLAMVWQLLHARRIFPEPGFVLTHGDTATTLWAAVAGRLAGCRVAHVESGLRSFRLLSPFPEEIVRRLTFRLARIHYCSGRWACDNLRGYRGERVDLGANTLRDAVQRVLEQPTTDTPLPGSYAVVSLHRTENILTGRLSRELVPLLQELASRGIELQFVLHPSTREALLANGGAAYRALAHQPGITLRERLPFGAFIRLLDGAEYVLTDGGSNQEELFYLGVPTLLLRDASERTEGLGGNVVLSHLERGVVLEFVARYRDYRRPRALAGDSPSRRLAADLRDRCLEAAPGQIPKRV